MAKRYVNCTCKHSQGDITGVCTTGSSGRPAQSRTRSATSKPAPTNTERAVTL